MKKIAALAVAALGALTASAFAADLPSRKAPPVVPVVVPVFFTWSGCYVGLNGGGVWVDKQWTDANGGTQDGQRRGSSRPSGGMGGAQAGCNVQYDRWVIGVQVDHDLTGASATTQDLFRTNGRLVSRVDYVGSATLRGGYAFDRLLAYLKGGLGWEGDRYHEYTINGGSDFGRRSESRTGWTAGLGLEYALTDNLLAFIEYDYYDFGTRTDSFVGRCDGPCQDTFRIREHKQVVKVGLNWKFGAVAVAPVVAKY